VLGGFRVVIFNGMGRKRKGLSTPSNARNREKGGGGKEEDWTISVFHWEWGKRHL